MINLDVSEPIDFKKSTENLCGNRKLLDKMLGSVEAKSLKPSI